MTKQHSVPAIALRDVGCKLGRKQVLRGVNLSLEPGQLHGLVGANAVGKTTLMRIIAGHLRGTGEVRVYGEDPYDDAAVMGGIFLAGIDNPLPSWKLRHVRRFAETRFSTFDRERFEELAERFALPMGEDIGQMSRGQRSAAAFVTAFATGCPVVLLDEPSLGLDYFNRAKLYELLQEVRAAGDTTIVLTTHHVLEAEALFDTISLLSPDGVRLHGAADDVAEAVVQIEGSSTAVDAAQQVLANVSARCLKREDVSGLGRAIYEGNPEEIRGVVRSTGVRCQQVTLETAIYAIGGTEDPS